ncbi:MAG: RecB-family nuclease [Candidatus Nezhaarchaeota archaeon]|nr:RecB-family nuclease [Candidatus Nezhaarchaeota archaeon]
MKEVIPVIHNVFSVEVVKQFAKLSYGLGFNTIVISKPTGAAAQAGVPEAQRLALKRGRALVVLGGIEDLMDLLKPSTLLMVTARKYAREEFDAKKLLNELEKGSAAIVFGGSEPGLSAREIEAGLPVHIGIDEDLGPLGFAAVVLYKVFEEFGRGRAR